MLCPRCFQRPWLCLFDCQGLILATPAAVSFGAGTAIAPRASLFPTGLPWCNMYLYAFLGFSALLRAACGSLLSLQVNQDGSYFVGVNGQQWLQSAGVYFSVANVVHSSAGGTLTIVNRTSGTACDSLGCYNYTSFVWTTGSSRLSTQIQQYDSQDKIVFAATYLDGVPSQDLSSETGSLSSTFPTLAPGTDFPQKVGSLYQSPKSGNCGWTVAGSASFPTASGGLLILTPPVPATAPLDQRTSLAFAALDGITVTRQSTVQGVTVSGQAVTALTAGVGMEKSIPAGFVSKVVLTAVSAASDSAESSLADWGVPLGGPNHAVVHVGTQLLQYYGKPRPPMNLDTIHSTLGYSVTGFYFYNPCDCGAVGVNSNKNNGTCGPDNGSLPFRLPSCTTYEDTLLQVHSSWKAARLPYGHMLLDSWWYGENIYNGAVWLWEDNSTMMQRVESFPATLTSFAQKVAQDGVILWAHNGRFSTDSPYLTQYPFAGIMPQGRDMWDRLFPANYKDWNLRTIKQDHVNDLLNSILSITNISQIDSWFRGMGDAAADAGVSIQYCCSPPVVLHNSVTVPAATTARSSPDYVQRSAQTIQNLPPFQWANGVETAFHYALGLMPDKDAFFSNSSMVQRGGDNTADPGFWPDFYSAPPSHWREVNPTRHALSAVLCGGPVTPSDAVNQTNTTLVWSMLRADGLVLRTSRPHTAVDAEMRSLVYAGWIAHDGTVAPSSVLDEGLRDNGDAYYPNRNVGEVYSTVTLLPTQPSGLHLPEALTSWPLRIGPHERQFLVPPAATVVPYSAVTGPCARWTIITASQVSVPLNLTAADLGLDPSALALSSCTANGQAWVAYEWDLDTFQPAESVPVVPVFASAAQVVLIPASFDLGYAAIPKMFVVAPVLSPLGYVLLGEGGKIVPVSPQRIASVTPVAGGLSVALIGAAAESVTMWFVVVQQSGPAAAASAAPFALQCTLGAAGVATLTVPSGRCA